MKNTFGQSVSVTIFGESHGGEIGVVVDGLAPGITIDEEYIASRLALRRPAGKISTSRIENDEFRIISGIFNGKTTGAPICIIIPNTNTHSADYEAMRALARPSHADYTAYEKYHGFEDYRGGGHFSGRLTAPIVAAGAIAQTVLASKGMILGTHISRLCGICDRKFDNIKDDIKYLSTADFPVLDEKAGEKMTAEILEAATDGDSVGGILECAVLGVPAGVGEPWFDSVESVLSHALFSIPAVKGVQFGDGFALSDMRGSKAGDAFRVENGKIVTKTNHNGGINGGITNGMPIIFSVAVKPTPSIFKIQETVDFIKGENAEITINGRHDPAIVHRARAVVDAVTALTLCDLLALRYGTDFFGGDK